VTWLHVVSIATTIAVVFSILFWFVRRIEHLEEQHREFTAMVFEKWRRERGEADPDADADDEDLVRAPLPQAKVIRDGHAR